MPHGGRGAGTLFADLGRGGEGGFTGEQFICAVHRRTGIRQRGGNRIGHALYSCVENSCTGGVGRRRPWDGWRRVWGIGNSLRLHGFRGWRMRRKPEDGIRGRGRETDWTPFCRVVGTGCWEGGQPGKRAGSLARNAFVATLGTGEPAAKPGPGAERDGVGWKHAAAPVGFEGVPCGRRPFSHRASLLLSRRY